MTFLFPRWDMLVPWRVYHQPQFLACWISLLVNIDSLHQQSPLSFNFRMSLSLKVRIWNIWNVGKLQYFLKPYFFGHFGTIPLLNYHLGWPRLKNTKNLPKRTCDAVMLLRFLDRHFYDIHSGYSWNKFLMWPFIIDRWTFIKLYNEDIQHGTCQKPIPKEK